MLYTSIISRIHEHCPETLIKSANKTATIWSYQIDLRHLLKTLHSWTPCFITSEGDIFQASDLNLVAHYDLDKPLYAQSDETLSDLNSCFYEQV